MAFKIENKEEWVLRILNGEVSPEEIRDFKKWLEVPENEDYFNQLKELWNLTSGPNISSERVETELTRFQRNIKKSDRRNSKRISYYKWAAVMLLPLALGIYLFLAPGSYQKSTDLAVETILPGESKAILTTADGRQIPLQSGIQERVEIGQNTFIRKDGKSIIYQDSIEQSIQGQYNRLTVPRGGEFHLVLSDGTEVYMNSASELRYPVMFSQDKREVYLSGEAYFHVKKDASKPFYVHTDVVNIRVYGTSFNVNTNQLGSVQTVLLSGSIGISGKGQEYVLRPSQLADFNHDGSLREIRDVDVKPFVAWRDGLFLFEDQSLENIMHTLSLWYDVEIFYAAEDVKNFHFTGYMERYQDIDKILKAINKMVGVNFKISGKTIIVSK